jgi:hypothetical protein
VVNAFGIGTLNLFFASGGGLDWLMMRDAVPHAVMNALFAPAISGIVEGVVIALGGDEAGRQLLSLAPRRRAV